MIMESNRSHASLDYHVHKGKFLDFLPPIKHFMVNGRTVIYFLDSKFVKDKQGQT